jgi:hypothetical protein
MHKFNRGIILCCESKSGSALNKTSGSDSQSYRNYTQSCENTPLLVRQHFFYFFITNLRNTGSGTQNINSEKKEAAPELCTKLILFLLYWVYIHQQPDDFTNINRFLGHWYLLFISRLLYFSVLFLNISCFSSGILLPFLRITRNN